MRKYRITYSLLLLLLAVLAAVMRDRYFVSMFLSALLLPLLSLLWLFLSVRSVEIVSHTVKQTPKKGYPVSMITTLRHPRWVFLPAATLQLFSGNESEAVILLSSELSSPSSTIEASEADSPWDFGGSEKPSFCLTTTMLFDCCGEYSFSDPCIKIMDLLHLFQLRKPLPTHAGVMRSILIYPNIYPLRDDTVFAREQEAERLYRSPSGLPDESNIIGYKIHQDADDSRYIHWKLSARGEEFLAKQFYSASQSNLLLALDLALFSADPLPYQTRITLDCLLETTVSLVSNYLSKGQELSLLYMQDRLHYEPLSSMTQFESFYQKSPYLGKNANVSLEQLLTVHGTSASAQQGNNVVLIMTPSVDVALSVQIKHLLALQWTILVIDCGYQPSEAALQEYLMTCPNLYYSTATQLYAETKTSSFADDSSAAAE